MIKEQIRMEGTMTRGVVKHTAIESARQSRCEGRKFSVLM
jgi:hypothetical protein